MKLALLCLLALASNTNSARRRPIPDADAAMTSLTPPAVPMSRASSHYSPVNPELSYLLGNSAGYPKLAVLARAAREHRTRGRSAVFVPSPPYNPQEGEGEAANFVAVPQQQLTVGEQMEFRPRQPLTPVYHATPLHQFGVKEVAQEEEAANYVLQPQQSTAKQVTDGEQTEYRPRQPIQPVYHATPLRPFCVLLDTAEESREANSFSAPTPTPTTGGSMGKLTEVIFPGKIVGERQSSRVAVVESRSLEHSQPDEHEHTNSAYEFGYAVRDERGGNFFGHSERRDSQGTSGSYHVFLPDGRLQSVRYTADHEGFHAHVSYKRPELTR